MDDDELCGWAELVQRSGSPARARTRLATGEVWRVLHDVYAPHTALDTHELRARALRRALPADVALSHRTALWLLGLDLLGDVLDVTAPRGRRVQARPGVRVHSAALPDEELCEVRGLLAVSAARALVDVARGELFSEAVAVGDAVLRSGAATPEQVQASLERSTGLRRVREARRVAGHLDGRSESLMESRLRVRFVLGGLRPEAQVDLYDERGHVARVDLVVDEVLVEFDGREAHLEGGAFARERRRQARLLEGGGVLRRYTAADVYRRAPDDLCAEVRRAAANVRRGRLRRGPDTLRAPRLRPLPTLDVRRAA
ncbi:MAG: hypothetical protein JWO60_1319 [Frankiales bacterium]|nr:hypothetical protein [Frankiales bacterium]